MPEPLQYFLIHALDDYIWATVFAIDLALIILHWKAPWDLSARIPYLGHHVSHHWADLVGKAGYARDRMARLNQAARASRTRS